MVLCHVQLFFMATRLGNIKALVCPGALFPYLTVCTLTDSGSSECYISEDNRLNNLFVVFDCVVVGFLGVVLAF